MIDSGSAFLAAVVTKCAGVARVIHLGRRARGFAKDHPRLEFLQRKGLTTWRQWPPAAWLGTKKAKDRIVESLRAGVPLNQWLATYVGATTMDETRR